MKDVKIVIGANYGDEGKGLMTRHFVLDAQKKNMNPIVIFHNGTAQRVIAEITMQIIVTYTIILGVVLEMAPQLFSQKLFLFIRWSSIENIMNL